MSRRLYGTSRTSAASTAGGKHVNLTRYSCSGLVQRSAPTCLDRCLACYFFTQHVVPFTPASKSSPRVPSLPVTKIQDTMPATGASISGASPQPGHGSLRFKRRSAGDGSPRFEHRSPQLRQYSGDGSLHLGPRSSQPRHRTRVPTASPPCHPPYSNQNATPVSLLSARVSYSSISRPCGGGRCEVREGQH